MPSRPNLNVFVLDFVYHYTPPAPGLELLSLAGKEQTVFMHPMNTSIHSQGAPPAFSMPHTVQHSKVVKRKGANLCVLEWVLALVQNALLDQLLRGRSLRKMLFQAISAHVALEFLLIGL